MIKYGLNGLELGGRTIPMPLAQRMFYGPSVRKCPTFVEPQLCRSVLVAKGGPCRRVRVSESCSRAVPSKVLRHGWHGNPSFLMLLIHL